MHTEQVKQYQDRQDQILEIFEAGVSVINIAKELGVSRTRVYQIIKKAQARRSKKEAMESDQ